jgi:Protein of unknown function (DUF3224)
MRRLLVALALVGVLLLTAVASAGAASPPASASGTFAYTSCIPNGTRSAGGNTTLDLTCAIAYSGTLSGTSTQSGPLLIHADGSTNFHGTETFTGTVNGVPGTLTFTVASVGDATSFQETVVIIGGTGALADLRGVLSAAGTVPGGGLPFGTYSGQIHAGQP